MGGSGRAGGNYARLRGWRCRRGSAGRAGPIEHLPLVDRRRKAIVCPTPAQEDRPGGLSYRTAVRAALGWPIANRPQLIKLPHNSSCPTTAHSVEGKRRHECLRSELRSDGQGGALSHFLSFRQEGGWDGVGGEREGAEPGA
jgi:hypothetical protein